MAKQRIVTLTTDFGTAGPYVAAMKGVILAIARDVTLVDITHDIPQGDVLAGAFVLRQALPFFPPGSVHCVVVDPGVGTDRRILAARYDGRTVVFPDNGVISLIDQALPLERIHVLRDERYFLGPARSHTFHGRDIIAPAAAHLINGLQISRLGPEPDTFTLLELPAATKREDGAVAGEVLHVDHFGNLISNISEAILQEALGDSLGMAVTCGGRDVGTTQPAYAFVEPGQPIAIVNSMALVEVAVNGGRACDEFDLGVGAEVVVAKPNAGTK